MRPRSALRRAIARAASVGREPGPGLRVLTYHRVNDDHPRDRLSVPSRAFAAQMEALARTGRPVMALDESLPALRGEAALPAGAVALTFDDGYADNHAQALPVLDRHGFKATFFVVTGAVGTGATIERYARCCGADRMLGWEEVRALHARGHSIGGHGRTHRELAGLDADEVRAEAEGCARDVEERVGERPRLFCYPRGSENAAVRRIVGESGYEAACTVHPGPNPPRADLLALRRTEVSGEDTVEDFRLKLVGGFDAWHALVQGLLRRRHA
ncbi:MAG TPA: polysaccharide deacetylase family protein [Vicinamibacteria bacterium]|nr:polysaccharide deacetylase family protein [Vicinamibacteria bacterium]